MGWESNLRAVAGTSWRSTVVLPADDVTLGDLRAALLALDAARAEVERLREQVTLLSCAHDTAAEDVALAEERCDEARGDLRRRRASMHELLDCARYDLACGSACRHESAALGLLAARILRAVRS